MKNKKPSVLRTFLKLQREDFMELLIDFLKSKTFLNIIFSFVGFAILFVLMLMIDTPHLFWLIAFIIGTLLFIAEGVWIIEDGPEDLIDNMKDRWDTAKRMTDEEEL